MGCSEGGSIISTVAGDGHDLTVGLQGLDKTLLIHWPCTGNYFQVTHTVAKLRIRELSEFRSCYDIRVTVRGIIPKSNLAADFFSCRRSVTGDNLNLDTGIHNLADSIGDIGTHRVRDSHYTEKRQIAGYHLVSRNSNITVSKHLVSEPESTHSLILIVEQQSVNFVFGHSGRISAHSVYNLRSSFHI